MKDWPYFLLLFVIAYALDKAPDPPQWVDDNILLILFGLLFFALALIFLFSYHTDHEE